MANIRKTTLAKIEDGVINYIYPKTSSDIVSYTSTMTVKEKLDLLSDGLNITIISNTTAYWSSRTSLISEKDTIYIYTDYKKNENNKDIPGIKIGDGLTYVVDLPFIDDEVTEHIADKIIHLSQQDRNKWDAKVRCYINASDSENLIFTNN